MLDLFGAENGNSVRASYPKLRIPSRKEGYLMHAVIQASEVPNQHEKKYTQV